MNRPFFPLKEDTQMVKSTWKDVQHHQSLGECKQPQWDIAYKKGKTEEKVFAGRNVEATVPLEKSKAVSCKTQHAQYLALWLHHSVFYIKNLKTYVHKITCTYIVIATWFVSTLNWKQFWVLQRAKGETRRFIYLLEVLLRNKEEHTWYRQ